MIAELIAGAILFGVGVSGWVAAYQSRGKANEAADRARLAEARAVSAERKEELAEANEAAVRSELRVAQVSLAAAQQTIARKNKERDDDIQALADSGLPVGDVLVDRTFDDLYSNADGDSGETSTGDGGQGGGRVPDDSSGSAGGTDPRG